MGIKPILSRISQPWATPIGVVTEMACRDRSAVASAISRRASSRTSSRNRLGSVFWSRKIVSLCSTSGCVEMCSWDISAILPKRIAIIVTDMATHTDSIAVLDFGSQYSQLIARRVREANVYCELFPWDAPADQVLALRPRGFILSGGPNSVYDPGAPHLPAYVLDSGAPVLGICYGMQLLAHALGGAVASSAHREYGQTTISLSPSSLWGRAGA